MANYDALINLKLSSQAIKDLKRIESVVGKINKPIVIQSKTANKTANKTAKTEAQILESKRAQQDMMSKTRRVGDLVQKQVDKGLKMGRAQEAIQKSALMNQKKEFAESEKLIKVALNELKIQKAITKEIAQQSVERGKVSKSSASGLSVSTGISSSRFGSVREPGSPRFIASRIGMVQGPQPASVNVKPSGPTSSLTRLTGNTPLGLSGVQAFPLTKELGMFGPKLPFLGKTTGFGSSPLLGSKDLVGSPKNILDVAKQNAMPVKGTPDLFGSPKYYEAVNKEAKKVAAMKGNVLPVSGMKHIVGSPEYLKEQARKAKLLGGGPTGFSATQYGPQQSLSTLQGPRMAGQAGPAFDLTGQSSPLNFGRRGELLRGKAGSNRFSPRNLARRFDRSSALISGAFPLLFGQGPIGAAAGALGGGIGGMFGTMGGFAGGIAATAIVQQIQSAITAIGELGKALGPFSQNTQAITASLGLQGSAQQAQIQLIEQVEGKTAAFNAAMKFMSNQIGEAGVNSLKRFGENSRLITSSMTLAATKLQAFGASILNFLLKVSGAERALRKADQERTVAFAASRGNKEAQAIQKEQEEINKLPKQTVIAPLPIAPFVAVNKVSSQEAIDRQKNVDQRREAFAIGEKERVRMGQINSEQQTLTRTLEEQFALREKTLKFVSQGESQALAEKLAKNELINEKATENLKIRESEIKDQLDGIDKQIELGNKTKKDKDALIIQEQTIKDLIEGQGKALADNNDKTRQLHDETKKLKITREEIANLLANETTNAIMGLIEGTKTLSESLAGIARQLASLFLNRAFGAMFGKIFGGEQGGYLRSGSFKAFQYGGVVSSPTLGMIGEGGEPEYVIPSSKMDGAMARYSAGARGGAVIPGGSGASGTVAGSSGNTIVEYTGPVLNFNGDEYVPKDSVPQIINAAAKQGATLGQSRTLNTLKNSRSSRAKIGI